jgi:pimeloyl-ACP methyl ester carboxylesterase
MSKVKLPGSIDLEYETFGVRSDPPVLLVAGFGAQLLAWNSGFCEELARRGRFVIRFDNRDTGLSSKFEQFPVDMGALISAAMVGDLEAVGDLAPYRLEDLADDAADLIAALGLDQVHVVGASMGGMVAQLIAIRHPGIVTTLTSMMSATGSSEVGQSTPDAFAALMKPVSSDRDGFIADTVASSRVWASKRYFDESSAAALAAASYDRGLCPTGTTRQLAALLATGSLESELAGLRLPVLVIHGTDDTLIDVSGGRRTAEVIPGAELLIVPDMGHDRPEALWPVLCGAIETHTRRSSD